MKFVYSNGGRLCNRIWSYVFMIAYSREFEEKLVVLDFGKYSSMFPNINKRDDIYFLKFAVIAKFIKFIFLIFNKISKLNTADVKNTHSVGIVNGWKYRSEKPCEKYYNLIKYLFEPSRTIIKTCTEKLAYHRENRTLVGVHIRREDYETFRDGEYYYSNQEYLMQMLGVKEILEEKTGKEVHFFIASTDEVNLKEFKGLCCVKHDNAVALEDLYSLSLCDYIIGPPSTFTMWASYYGKVPLMILDKRNEVEYSNFKVVSSVDCFEDGTKFVHSS